jgi:hypothetical protein
VSIASAVYAAIVGNAGTTIPALAEARKYHAMNVLIQRENVLARVLFERFRRWDVEALTSPWAFSVTMTIPRTRG